MNTPSPADAALYANHRRFLEAQRGSLTRREGFDAISGDVAAYQIAILNDAAALERAAAARPTIFAPPWARANNGAFVSNPNYELAHMSLQQLQASPERRDLSVEVATNERALREFTEVQTAGFAEREIDAPSLFDWFWPKNLAAMKQVDQRFYILRRNGAPVSGLITVDTSDALGIYGVATPPALRKQGLSTHLLNAVCAGAGGVDKQICLQVVHGSDAERLYRKLGFVERFRVTVHTSRVLGG